MSLLDQGLEPMRLTQQGAIQVDEWFRTMPRDLCEVPGEPVMAPLKTADEATRMHFERALDAADTASPSNIQGPLPAALWDVVRASTSTVRADGAGGVAEVLPRPAASRGDDPSQGAPGAFSPVDGMSATASPAPIQGEAVASWRLGLHQEEFARLPAVVRPVARSERLTVAWAPAPRVAGFEPVPQPQPQPQPSATAEHREGGAPAPSCGLAARAAAEPPQMAHSSREAAKFLPPSPVTAQSARAWPESRPETQPHPLTSVPALAPSEDPAPVLPSSRSVRVPSPSQDIGIRALQIQEERASGEAVDLSFTSTRQPPLAGISDFSEKSVSPEKVPMRREESDVLEYQPPPLVQGPQPMGSNLNPVDMPLAVRPDPSVGRLIEWLNETLVGLQVSDRSSGPQLVRMELKSDLLPGVSVTFQEVDGRIQVDLNCRVDHSRKLLASLVRREAPEMARRCRRDLLLRVHADGDDLDSADRLVEVLGTP